MSFCCFHRSPVVSVFRVSDTTIDTEAIRKQLFDPSAGGFCAFEGWVRDHNEGHVVQRLEYEVYTPLAVSEGNSILSEAKARFPFECIHRSGQLDIGDVAVWVGVSAPHRDEAFKACRYIIDEVKVRLPIWKKEYYANGDSGWVNCERCASVHSAHNESTA